MGKNVPWEQPFPGTGAQLHPQPWGKRRPRKGKGISAPGGSALRSAPSGSCTPTGTADTASKTLLFQTSSKPVASPPFPLVSYFIIIINRLLTCHGLSATAQQKTQRPGASLTAAAPSDRSARQSCILDSETCCCFSVKEL